MKAAVVGSFDGVHRGHAFLLDTLKTEAAARGLKPLALTFSSHPLALIDPERAPTALSSAAEREHLLRSCGVEAEVLPFTPELRAMTAEEFLAMLRERYDVGLFLLGYNNCIGSDRVGPDSPRLAEISRRSGVEILAASAHPAEPISSSAIRAALAGGDVDRANALLGRPYDVEGTVVTGRQLGRTIGFPTANLQVDSGRALPAEGTYIGRMLGHRAVVNIGRRPTVDRSADAPLSVEAYILDFDEDLYGRRLKLEFLHRLRNERRFASVSELKGAIAADVIAARKYVIS